MAAETRVLAELLNFSVPVVVRDEFDFSSTFIFFAFRNGDDGEEFPVGMVDGVFEFAFKVLAAVVGMSGFDEVVDKAKKESAVARAHECLGGFGQSLVLMKGQATILIALFALTGAERKVAFFWDFFKGLGHRRVLEASSSIAIPSFAVGQEVGSVVCS